MTPAAPSVHVFTFREGLFSRFGHDLCLHVGRFDVRVEAGRVLARFDTTSLAVDGAMRDERLDPAALAVHDRKEIARTISAQVLDAARHPEAVVDAQVRREGVRAVITGDLTLRGRHARFEASARIERTTLRVETELIPSRWGITPYRAMGGALRVRDLVRVELHLPTGAHDLASAELSTLQLRWTLP